MTHRLLQFVAILYFAASPAMAGDGKVCSASARECEQEIKRMLSGRRYLGVDLVQAGPGVIIIKAIKADGPASRADLKEGDRFIAVNGRDLRDGGTVRHVKEALAAAKETGSILLIVQRRGSFKRVHVRMEPYSSEQLEKIITAHLSQSHPATAGGSNGQKK
jgi:predicted metalloprotease with PDZ domain